MAGNSITIRSGINNGFFKRSLLSLFMVMSLLLPQTVTAIAAGGDVIPPFPLRDNRPGKQVPTATAVDSSGNTIISGYQILPGEVNEEIYTVKMSSSGSILWRGIYNVSGTSARAVAVAVDQSGAVFVTANVAGADTSIITVKYPANPVLKGDGTAQESWVKSFDAIGTDMATAIAVTAANGYVYVSGSSRFSDNESFMLQKYQDNGSSATLVWQIPAAGNATTGKARSVALSSSMVAVTGQSWSGSDHFFKTIVYNLDGQKLWEKQYAMATPPQGHVYNDSGLFIRFDSKEHLVVSGTVYNDHNSDMYTAKYCTGSNAPCSGKNPGDLLWEKIYNGGSDDEPSGLAVDSESRFLDNVYVTGRTMSTGGINKVFTARYEDAVGTPVEKWQAVFSPGAESSATPLSIAADQSGNLYIAGYSDISGSVDFQTIKYRKGCQPVNGSCAEIWQRRFNGSANLSDRAISAMVDPLTGRLLVAGYADETAPIESGATTAAIGTSDSPVRIVNSGASWATDRWRGYYVKLTSGINNGEFRQILSNDATTLTVAHNFPASASGKTVASGDSYYLFDLDNLDYYLVKYDQGTLNPPTNLTATTTSNSAINLSWQDNNDVTPKFRVERCTNGTTHLLATPCNFDIPSEVTVVSDGSSSTSFTDSSLTGDKYYYYRVKAYSGADFASADQITYPTATVHAITQLTGSVAPAAIYSYAGVANNDDYALSIAVGPDRNPVVTGKSFFTPGGFDYYTVKLDRSTMAKTWSQRYNDPEEQGDEATCVAVDNNNQIIVSGYSWLHNPATLTDMNSIYTIKYLANAAAEPETDEAIINQWSHQYNGPNGGGDDKAISIATTTDSSNNVAVVGMGLHSPLDLQKHDIYVLRFPPGGAGAAGYWAATPIHKGDDNQPVAVAFDPSGNVIITGMTGNLVNSVLRYGIYTAKFAASTGALLWESTYGGQNGDAMANDLAVDPSGNIYVTGFSTNTSGNRDFVTLKYDASGNLQWGGAKVYDGPAASDDEAVSIKYDPIDKSIVVAGDSQTDVSNSDIHVIRYSAADGAVIWEKRILRENSTEEMFDMTMNPSGAVYIAATTTNSANPDQANNRDIITFKIDSLGNLDNNTTLYGSQEWFDKPYGIVSNSYGEIFVAGIAMNSQSNADYVVLKISGDDIQSPYPVTIVPSYISAKLDWTDNSRNESGYEIARRNGACTTEPIAWNPATEIIATVPQGTLTYTDSTLTQATSYCYGIRTKSASSFSRWVNSTVTTGTPPPPDTTFASNLNIPNNNGESGYGAKSVDSTTVKFTWGIPSYPTAATGFEVWRCMDGSGNSPCSDFTLLANVTGATTSSYTDSAVCPGATYRYKVKALGTGWSSDFSAASGVILPSPDSVLMDGGFESADPDTPWYSPVGGNYAGSATTSSAAVKSGSRGFILTADNSQVTGSSTWNIATAPASATVGSKLSALGDNSLLAAAGWRSKRALTALTANTVFQVTVSRDTAITDGTEPQLGFRDLRVYDSTTNTVLPSLFITSSSATSATIWFKNGANSSGIYLYYGNPTATLTDPALSGNQIPVDLPAPSLGRKQPVNIVNGGKYTISACLKANLNKGQLVVNGNNMVTTIPIIDSKSGNTNYSFNKDGNWHCLSEVSTSTITTVNANTYLRAYLTASSGDTATIATSFPDGTAYVDDLSVTPYYGLTVSRSSERQLDLAWSRSSFDATGYKIERCTGSDSYCSSNPANFSQIATVTATTGSYSDISVLPDTTYTYRIRPFKSFAQACTGSPGWNGSGWDGAYSAINATAAATTTNNPPSSLTAKGINTTLVNVNWNDTTDTESGFELWRCKTAGCSDFSKLPVELPPASGSGAYPTYSDSTVCSSSNYSYRVKAYNAGLSLAAGGVWTKRVPLTMTNGQANFQTKITVSYASGMNSNFSDLRIVDVTANRELPYWLESATSGVSAVIWFKPLNPANSLYLYFGNASATASSVSGSQIFDFFDDFNGTTLSSQWSSSVTGAATLTVGSGLANLDATANSSKGNYLSMSAVSPPAQPYRLEARVSVSSAYLGQNLIRIRGLGGIGDTGIFDVGSNKLQAYFNSAASNQQVPADTFVRWRAAMTGDSNNSWSVFKEDGSPIYSNSYTGTPYGISFMAGDSGGGNGKFSIDWIYARKYATVEPVVTPGTVETNGSGYSFSQLWDGFFSTVATAVTPLPANLLTDPDFENGVTSWPTAVGTATGTSSDSTTGNYYSGAKSLKLTATGATLGLAQTVTVIPGASYTLSGYMKSTLTAGTAICDVYGTNIDSPGINASGTTAWSLRSETVTIPTGTTSVQIRCFANGAPQGSAWIDMVQFVPQLPVTAVTASRASESQINLTWSFPATVTDLTGFKIDRCADSACSSVLTTLTANGAATRSFSDTGLPINSSYWYRVRAYKSEDPSCNSAKGFWETASSAAPYPAASTSLLAPGNLTLSHVVSTLCEDLRLVDSDGNYLSYYLANKDDLLSQCNRTATKLIVKFPSVPITTGKSVYLYYDNPLATAKSSGSATFDFFDDFDYTDISGLDAAKWDLASSNLTGFTIANSMLHGTNSGSHLRTKAPYSFGAGYAVQAKVKTQTIPSYGFTPISFYSSWYSNAGILHSPGSEYYSNNAAYTQMSTTPPTGTAQSDSLIFQINNKNSSSFTPSISDVEGSNNLSYWSPGDISQSITARPVLLGIRVDSSYAGYGYSADWEWLRVRKSTTTPPSSALGSLDVSGAPYTLAQDSSSWRFRKPVTLSYSGSALTDYQVNVVTDTTTLAVDRNTLTWTDTTSGETSFTIERCDGSDCTTSSFPRVDKSITVAAKSGFGSQVSYTDRETAAAVNYCYRVKGVNPAWTTTTPVAGETAPSNTVCQLSDDPAAPTNVVATPGTSSVALSWTDGSKNETGFKLERCQDNTNGETACGFIAGNSTVTLLPPNDNSLSAMASYTDNSVGCSGTFRYRISAWRGDLSAPIWLRGPSAATSPVSIGIPAAPSNVVATRVNEQQINISWRDNTPDESSFEVWRCINAGCSDFAKLPVTVAAASGVGSTVTYADNYLITPGSTYGYQIKAVITGSCAATSPPSAPNSNSEYAIASYAAPTSLLIVPSGTTQANITWVETNVADTGFAVKRCLGAAPCSGSFSSVATTAPSATGYNDSSACSDSTYNYSIAPMLSPSMPFSSSGGQSWKSRLPLSFTSFQPNFITQVVIPYDTEMKADFSDIRFWDRTAGVELPYWIASSTATSATVWFKSGANSAIDIYFGNASATSASSKESVIGSGLVGYWPFEETSGTITGTTADKSGSSLNGTLSGFTTGNGIVTGGINGNALKLNGAPYINIADTTGSPLDITDQISIELWYKYEKSADWARIISKSTSDGNIPYEMYAIWLDATADATPTNPQQRVYFGFGSQDSPPANGSAPYYQTLTGPQLTPGQWYHLVARYDSTTGKESLFVNGVEYGLNTLAAKPKIITNNVPLYLGGRGTGYSNFNPLKGTIDEVRLYSRALTATEIASRYAATLPAASLGSKIAIGATGTSVVGNVITPSPANLLLNSDFESGTSYWNGYPNMSGIGAYSSPVFSGQYSMRIFTTLTANSSKLFYQSLTNLAPGTNYLLKGYMNLALPLDANHAAFCYLTSWGVNWSSPSIWISGTDSRNNSGWVPFSVPITIPLNNPGGAITIGNVECGISRGAAGSTATNTVYFDAVQLVADQPTVLAATRASESEVKLSWNDPFTDETGMTIYRCQGSSCSFGTIPYKQLAASVQSYVDTGLIPGETYKYKVTAYKTATCPWESNPSNTVSIATIQTAPTLSATTLTATSVQLTWTDTANGETGYNIERCVGSSCNPAGSEIYHSITPTARTIDGLKARYSFNGNLNDSSGSGLHLTAGSGTPAYEDGGLILSSANSIYSPSTSILDGDQHTIEFDMKLRTIPGNSRIFTFEVSGSTRSPEIWTTNGDARLAWRYDPGYTGVTGVGSSGVNGTPFNTGTWYHVVGVKNGGSLKLYINGVLVSDTTVANPKTPGAGVLWFAHNYNPDMVIKNFSIYNTSYSGQNNVTFTDSQACPNSTYTYRVTAFNPAWPTSGTGSAVASNNATATTLIFNPPRSLVAQGTNETQNDLSWLASTVNDQTGFRVRKCQGSDCTTDTVGNQLTYSSSGLTAETGYCYAVASYKATTYCNGSGGDANGIISSYTADSCATTSSRHPVSLTATALGSFRIQLNWKDQSGDEEAFEVETKLWNGQWVKTAKVTGHSGVGNDMQFIDTIGINPLKTYTYRVRAYRGGVSSPPSNEASATTPPFIKNNSNTCQ
ncbi:MAG: DUF2341 domain-containing protein [Geobacteraceae bacterium]|nr:DUF2341 domain-containing protein [Geobacteraceae bacterium]